MGLLVGGQEAIAQGMQAWMNDAQWQGLRKYVEDSFVVQDWFELFVAQNVVCWMVLLFPLMYGVYEHHMSEKSRYGAVADGAFSKRLVCRNAKIRRCADQNRGG